MKRRWMSLTAILTGMGSSAVMQTYLSVFMPSIIRDLGGMPLYNWVFGAYMLASTVTIPLFGKMADLFGRRRLYLTGLILFTAGLLLCGLSAGMPMLVACRALMGIGAGAVTPAAIGMTGGLFEEKDLPKVFGIMGLTQVLANLLGPLMGGYISDTFSWRIGFMTFLPLELACMLLISLGPPSASTVGQSGYKARHRISVELKKLDWTGSLLISAGLVGLVLGLQFIGWKRVVPGICLAALSSLLLWSTFHWERWCPQPVLPVSLLRQPVLRDGMISVFLLGIIHNSSATYLSLYYQNVLGKSATDAGMLLIPMLVSAGVSSAVCGKVPVRAQGMVSRFLWLTAALSFIGIALLGSILGGLAAMLFSIPIGLAIGFMLPIFLGDSQSHADDSNRAVSGGMVQLSRNLGGAVGVSLLGVWISGPLPVPAGLTGIFLCLGVVGGFALLFTLLSSRYAGLRQQNLKEERA